MKQGENGSSARAVDRVMQREAHRKLKYMVDRYSRFHYSILLHAFPNNYMR
jgi:hypothetical protein